MGDMIVVPAPGIPKGHAACKVCHRKLDAYTERNLRTGEETLVGFTHAAYRADHVPEPVRCEPDSGFKAVCDFCSSENPIWAYPCGTVVAIDGDEFGPNVPDSRTSDEWAACQPCYDDIERNRWESVARRSVDNLIKAGKVDRSHRGTLLHYTRNLHRKFRAERCGDAFLSVVIDFVEFNGPGNVIVPPEAR